VRLEWAFRLISEPRRLWRRYLVSGPRIFLIFGRWNPS
jgi:UDP-N-acetyl-D-mannosaminuronic acid transferase (WecB/TagA/CpsF family)